MPPSANLKRRPRKVAGNRYCMIGETSILYSSAARASPCCFLQFLPKCAVQARHANPLEYIYSRHGTYQLVLPAVT